MLSRTVSIVEYQATWSAEYELIAAELRVALGSRAIQIDHIGSTAVSALAAKDIIDVQVTVDTLDTSISDLLLDAGFTTRTDMYRQDHLPPGFEPNELDWAKFFFMQKPGARRSNIHIRQVGKPNQRYPLLVRDYLRAEEGIAAAYGELKRRLASTLADLDTYPDVKDRVADIIYLAAERWAVASNWQPAAATPASEA